MPIKTIIFSQEHYFESVMCRHCKRPKPQTGKCQHFKEIQDTPLAPTCSHYDEKE